MTNQVLFTFGQMKNGVSVEDGDNFINPWSVSTLKDLLQKMNSKVVQFEVKPSSMSGYKVSCVNCFQGI